MSDLTYCEECLGNFEDERFDYRFERPICLSCAEDLPCDDHEYDNNNICFHCGTDYHTTEQAQIARLEQDPEERNFGNRK